MGESRFNNMHGISKSPQLLVATLLFAAAASAQSPGNSGSTAPASTAPPGQSVPGSNSVTPSGATVAPAAPALAIPTASATLRSALDQVQNALIKTHTERWKRGSVRDEAGSDIGSIKSDMQSNIPNLIHDADGSPGSLSKMLPVAKHIDALYDVLLRVVEASRISAPDDQADTLRQALTTLGTARLAFDDQMQQSATTQEKQIVDLRATVQKQAAFKCPAPPPEKPCPPPAPVHKPRKKPAPSTTAPTGTPTQQKPGATQQPQQKPGATQQQPQKPGTSQQTQKPNPTSPNQQPH